MSYYAQAQSDIRCEWGLEGVQQVAADCDAIIIIDVLSFSTCVEIATTRGAVIYPYGGKLELAQAFAHEKGAFLASRDRTHPFSLSPQKLMVIPTGTRLVLPSPNGSTLSAATGHVPTFAACLRNAAAVAEAAQRLGSRIAVIPAGERWRPEQTLRPALEDWLGAGAVINALDGQKSAEALAAQHIFRLYEADLLAVLSRIGSGIELIEEGCGEDVALAAQLNISRTVPRLLVSAYQHHAE